MGKPGFFDSEAAHNDCVFGLPYPGRIFGFEQEYEVFSGDRQVDFRQIIKPLADASNRTACPAGDVGFYLDSGALLICDGWEAEMAATPELVGPALFRDLPDNARHLRDDLLSIVRQRVPGQSADLSLKGYSTHFSASCMSVDISALSRLYARTMAPAMMLMMDVTTSPGLLVRARQNRFEIGGDFIPPGDRLSAAALFFAASYLAALDSLVRGDDKALPFQFDDTGLEPTVQRRGTFAGRAAFGDDLYTRGREALLRLADGSQVNAQQMLSTLWAHLEPIAAELAHGEQVALVSRMISGASPLPLETQEPTHARLQPGADPAQSPRRPHLFAECLKPRSIGTRRITPFIATWDYVTYRVEERSRNYFLNVPFADARSWLEALSTGNIDAWMEAQTGDGDSIRTLSDAGDAQRPGVFDEVDEAALSERFNHLDPKKKKKKEGGCGCEVLVDRNGDIRICMPQVADTQTVLVEQEPPQNELRIAEGVWVNNGSFGHDHIDHRVLSRGADFAFARHYRSGIDYLGPIGRNWDHGYNIRVVVQPPPTAEYCPGGWCERFNAAETGGPLTFYHGTGRVTEHAFASWAIRWVKWCDADFFAVVTTYRQNDGEDFEIERYAVLSGKTPKGIKDEIFFRIRYRGGTQDFLDCEGRCVRSEDKNRNTTWFTYGLPFDPGTKTFVLREITDSIGRKYKIDYQFIGGGPRISTVTDPWQRTFRYVYDANIQLTDVVLVAGAAGTPRIRYRYAAGARAGLLSEIVNPQEAAGSNASWLKNKYDSNERVVSQRVGSPTTAASVAGGTYGINYASATQVIVTDRMQVKWTYQLRQMGASKVVRAISVRDQVGTGGTRRGKTLRTSIEYDQHYHIDRMVHPSGREQLATYRNVNRSVTLGDERDDVFLDVTHYNDLGRDARLTMTRVGIGGTTRFQTTYKYEWLFGALTEMRSPMGLTTLEYDQGRCATPQYNGNPLKVTYPAQALPTGGSVPVVSEYDYAPGGIPKYYKDPDGIEQEWTIDGAGRIRRNMIGGELVEAFSFSDRGTIDTRTDARNRVWRYTYDDRDLVTAEVDPLFHVRFHNYNLNDWPVLTIRQRVDDPASFTGIAAQGPVRLFDVTAYDILGQRTAITEVASGPVGSQARSWQWEYDAEQRETLQISPRATSRERSDARIQTLYTARGQITSHTSGFGGTNEGTVLTYYDEDGNVSLVIDPIGQRTVTNYDDIGRPLTEERPNGAIRHLEYRGPVLLREWVEGPLTARPTQLGGSTVTRVLREIVFTVDANHQPIVRKHKIFDPRQRPAITAGGGTDWVEQTWFTPGGRLQRQRDPAGNDVDFKWNPQSRLEKVTLPGGHSLAYSYDGDLVLTATATMLPDAGITGPLPPANLVLQEVNSYDDLGRRLTHRDSNGTLVSYAYDSDGNLRGQRSALQQGSFTVTEFRHDGFGRLLTQITDAVASSSNPDGQMRLAFEYDLNDNRIGLTDDLGRVTKVTFDGRDQALTIQQPEQRDLTFTRRQDGRIKKAVRTGGRTSDFTYSRTGKLTEVLHRNGAESIRQTFGLDGLDRMWWAADSNGGAQFRVQTYRAIDSMGRTTSERTSIPEFTFDETVIYKYGIGRLDIGYPDPIGRATYQFSGDGNAKSISFSRVGTLVAAKHQGPGRLLQTERPITLNVRQPAQTLNLKVRTSQRLDTKGRPNFRVLHITDEINRPGQPNYLALSTSAEKTSYEVNGLPFRRDFGVIGQPGTSVDSTFVYDGLSRAKTITEGEGNDFANFDYDWDGAGRLRSFETNGRKGGQIVDEATSITYSAGQRVDQLTSAGNPVGTTTWKFDDDGRLINAAETQPPGSRAFGYDALDRLSKLDVFTPGTFTTSQDTSTFLYDALGRIIVRTRDGTSEFYIHDRDKIIAEFDNQQRAVRRYIYDERRSLIHYGLREGARWRNFHPIVMQDGAPWLLLEGNPTIATLPPPPGAMAAAVTRSAYFRTQLPIIREENRWRPFEKGVVIRYDYTSGTGQGAVVDASLLPLDTGGRRYFAEERLFANGPRFYDPALRSFIQPDPLGAWGHSMAYGNPYAYAGNNPVAFGDDGFHPAVVGLLIIAGIGALIGGAISASRQGVQLLEGSRRSFSFGEVGLSMVFGFVAAPVLVLAPELAIPLVGLGLANTYSQYRSGQIGGATVAFDAVTLLVPFAFKGVRSATFGRDTYIGQLSGLGPAASAGARAARFEAFALSVGQAAARRGLIRSRALSQEAAAVENARFTPETLQQLDELGGFAIEGELTESFIARIVTEERVGSGQQGTVFESADNPALIIKIFNNERGAANEIAGLHEFRAAVEGRTFAPGATPVRVVRVYAAGRTSTGRSFIVKQFAEGDIIPAHIWLEEGGHASLLAAMQATHPSYNTVPFLSLRNNLVQTPERSIIIFDPM
ncbi:RHS repeat-associated core domain-containing protein [uncultured Roseobacter sp.]|uniref:RHS repeat domain-containing protein n=1 Tax=uncultured Roseobacter sp. TaxID=114847 RepID=UPI00261992A5|nr:RHS repeat-associated core domain-containing protein [uncultured Roseobacter sp.]